MIAIAALAGALTVAGVLGILTGLRPVPEPGPGHRRARRGARSAALARLSRRTRMQLLAGLLATTCHTAFATPWPLLDRAAARPLAHDRGVTRVRCGVRGRHR